MTNKMFSISSKVTFSVLFILLKAELTVSKLILQLMRKMFNIRVGKIRFGIWRVTFLRIFILFLPLENFGTNLRFLCSGRFITCPLRWDRVYCLSICFEISRSTGDRERNRTFSQICISLQKMNQQKWNLAHIEKKDIAAASMKIWCKNFNPVKR